MPTTTTSSTLPPCDPQADPGECVRHFQCFELKRGIGPFPPDVGATDRFTSLNLSLLLPDRLCAPANQSGTDPSAPGDPEHLAGYPVMSHPVVAVRGLRVDNAFGTVVLDTTRLQRLLVPTAKSLDAPPPPLASPSTDHFACYKVRPTRGQGISARFRRILGIAVQDQFGTRTVNVLKPSVLCAPADVDGASPLAPAHSAHLLCYRTRSVGPRIATISPIFIANELGNSIVAALRTQELCVPSQVNPLVP